MRVMAGLMFLSGAAVAAGAVMEFVYFGPPSPQFWAGVAGTAAGALGMAGGAALWRRGVRARRFVTIAALGLLAGTAIATALRVMGPPATLIGLAGSLPPVVWAWKAGIDRDKHGDHARQHH